MKHPHIRTTLGRYAATVVAFVGIALLTGCATSGGPDMTTTGTGGAPSIETGFLNRSMTVNGVERYYAVYVPREYDPSQEWPLILFLHGAGERGGGGLIQTEVGIGRAIRRHGDWFPAIVLMPQCPAGEWWTKDSGDIDVSLAQTLAEFNIDRDRIYITGLSMGGQGTWEYGAAHADMFAAAMPICGVKPENPDIAALATLPIWAFHGGADSVVPVEATREMVEALKAAGGDVQYTEYPGVDHNSWDDAYGERDAIKWLFEQKRK